MINDLPRLQGHAVEIELAVGRLGHGARHCRARKEVVRGLYYVLRDERCANTNNYTYKHYLQVTHSGFLGFHFPRRAHFAVLLPMLRPYPWRHVTLIRAPAEYVKLLSLPRRATSTRRYGSLAIGSQCGTGDGESEEGKGREGNGRKRGKSY